MAGITLTNPFDLRGATSQYPFRGSLVYRVLDASGNQVGRGPFEVVGRLGGSATFAVQATYAPRLTAPARSKWPNSAPPTAPSSPLTASPSSLWPIRPAIP
ncbi:MAG: hypothetical protein HC875_34865 [Anaerolineales bacterium]|nr:hypothetical protein [Anaerolineales bacterium]